MNNNEHISKGKAIAIILSIIVGGVALIGGVFFFALSDGGFPSFGRNDTAIVGEWRRSGVLDGLPAATSAVYHFDIDGTVVRVSGMTFLDSINITTKTGTYTANNGILSINWTSRTVTETDGRTRNEAVTQANVSHPFRINGDTLIVTRETMGGNDRDFEYTRN